MDSLTHVLFGATLAQTGFRQRLGRRATLATIALASLPDLDVVAGLVSGRFGEWQHHRGFTHSLIFAPIAGPLIGWSISGFERWRAGPVPGEATGDERLRWWIRLAFLALLSHPVLDVFTSYGTQLLWPLTNVRFAVDAVAIIDPFYSLIPLTIALIVGVAKPASARRVALKVFAFMTAYVAGAWALNGQIEKTAAADFGRPAEIQAYPLLFQPFFRRVLAVTPETAHVGYYSLLNPRPIAWHVYPQGTGGAVEAVRRTGEAKLFEWFSMDKVLWRATPDGQGRTTVEATDLRYGMIGPTDFGQWGIRATVDGGNAILGPLQPFGVPRDTSGAALRRYWTDITGW
jgi:inner membrane protein